ncbi:MAG: four helix bundle protein [Melioribacteraceae bacterium]|nr:four helix bundle protein [Melioribacteraceae bacterium]MCF8356082.1 four helix bundle protein [Melioribacteraceae bacterium]MCF8395537.1 four helix bundle protein [Melioribacteraceae bacterium]MCF8420609.1 four helix bundle protein [Melioribacteraceae bacterium]
MTETVFSRRRNLNRGYMKLDVWKASVELSVMVRKKLKKVSLVSYKLKGQIEDSVVSVPSNIAEGYSRRHIREYIQHINYSLASLSENFTQIIILKESNDIEDNWFELYDNLHYLIENKLLALIRSLIKKVKDEDGWANDYVIKDIIETYEAK